MFFESSETDRTALTEAIEAHLLKELSYAVPVFLRTPEELEAVLAIEAFKAVEVTPETRLMIVFTRGLPRAISNYPHRLATGDLEIVGATDNAVFVVLRLINGRLGDLEKFLRGAYETKLIVTTRFYDTTGKILQAARDTSPDQG